jgi:hypothetical protein
MELITSVTILGLIIGPLIAAMTFFVDHGAVANEKFSDDASIRSMISVFSTDVQSAESVTLADPAPCGPANPALVTMKWTDGATIFRASWSTQASGTKTELVRHRCTGSSLVSTIVVGDVGSAPTITCQPACSNASTVTITGTASSGAEFTVSAKRRTS